MTMEMDLENGEIRGQGPLGMLERANSTEQLVQVGVKGPFLLRSRRFCRFRGWSGISPWGVRAGVHWWEVLVLHTFRDGGALRITVIPCRYSGFSFDSPGVNS